MPAPLFKFYIFSLFIQKKQKKSPFSTRIRPFFLISFLWHRAKGKGSANLRTKTARRKPNLPCAPNRKHHMLENWLSPVPLGEIVAEPLAPWHLGSHLRIYTGDGLPSLKGVRIALVGVGEKDANAVRSALYSLSFPMDGLKIADLGNIRKNNLSFIIPALAELMEARILPVLIGNDLYFGLSLYKAAQQILKNINLVVADERIRFRPEQTDASDQFLNEIILPEESQLFHLGLIGYQTHFTPPETLREMERRNFPKRFRREIGRAHV